MSVKELAVRPTVVDMGLVRTELGAEQIKIFSAHERFAQGLDTNCQTNWKRVGDRYVPQEQNSHRIGNGITKEIAQEFNRGRDIVIFEKVTNPVLCFGCQEKQLSGDFLTVSWFSLVGKPGARIVEQLTFFLHGFTVEQAELIPQELLSRGEFLPVVLKEDAVSLKENIDLLSPKDNWVLKTFNTLLTEQQKKDPKNQVLLEQTKRLEARRYHVHSGELKKFETHPQVIWVMVNGKREARVADFDNIKQCWVQRRETTNDALILANIEKTEALITLNWKPGKSLVLRTGIGLSARTAGQLQENSLQPNQDLDAISNLFIDGNGIIRETSEFVSRIPGNEIYKQGPQDVTSEYFPQILPVEPLSMLPLIPGSLYLGPILSGASNYNAGIPNQKNTKEISPEVFALGLAAPATFGFLGETINHLSLVDLTEQDSLTLERKSSAKDASNIGVEPSREAEGLDDYRILEVSAELDFSPDALIFPERDNFFPEPPKDDGNGGGGGFVPHREWNSLDKVENHKEQVVFDVSQKKESKPEKEVMFHQYAADLGVVRAETVEDMELLEQESNTPLLLVGVRNTPVEEDKEVNKKDLETENVYEESELQETIHYNTAQYYSEDDVKDELLDQIIEGVVPVEQAQEKHEQPNNFFIPTALLTNYLLWREMFSHNQISGINIGVNPSENNQEAGNNRVGGDQPVDNVTQNNSFLARTEQHKTQPKRVKVRAKITNPAFLALLLLTKLKLLTKVKLLARKNSLANFKQLFVTDTLLLFLINPKLFLVKNYFWQNKDKTVTMNWL